MTQGSAMATSPTWAGCWRTLGLPFQFAYQNWADFYPALQAGEGDVILCGQGISAHRKTLADFTEPYAVFDEAVMIRRGANLRSPSDLSARKSVPSRKA
jgi:polar amino acid transport system substrate-binding protein